MNDSPEPVDFHSLPVVYFGPRWDAPLLDGHPLQVPAPVGERCLYCGQEITADDRGLIRLHVEAVNCGGLEAAHRPVHMECDLRSVTGNIAHLEGLCACTGGHDEAVATIGWREESLAVLKRINQEREAAGRPPL